MAIWDEYVVVTGVAGTYLFEDQEHPNLVKEAMLGAIIADEEIVPPMLDAYGSKFGPKADAFYDYGKDHFVNGLPSGYKDPNEGGDSNLYEQMIEAEIGEEVRITYSIYTPVDTNSILGISWMKDLCYAFLQRDYGDKFDYATAEVFDHWNNRNRISVVTAIGKSWIRPSTIVYTLVDKLTGETIQDDIFHKHSYDVKPESYYMARYIIESDLTQKEWAWAYYSQDGTHDDLIGSGIPVSWPDLSGGSAFYPIAPLRVEKLDTVDDGEWKDVGETKDTIVDGKVIATTPVDTFFPSELNKTTRALLKTVDLDLDDLTKGINENENAGAVDSAFVTFGCNIQSKGQVQLKYLYDFFENVTATGTVDKSRHEDSIEGDQPTPAHNAIGIKDGEFDNTIVYNYHTSKIVTGKFNDLDADYESDTEVKDRIKYTDMFDKKVKVEQSIFYIRRKIDSNSYREIAVHGLMLVVRGIYKKGITKKTLEESMDIGDAENPAERGFIIPLNRTIVESYSSQEQDEMHLTSLVLYIYAEQRKKLKWYETSWFGKILVVVAVVLTFLGYDGSTFLEFAAYVISAYATNYAIQMAFEGLADFFGSEFAFWASLVVAFVAIGYSSYTDTGTYNTMAFADDLMKAVTATSYLSGLYVESAMTELMEESEEFLKDAEEKEEELRLAAEGLEDNTGLTDPLLTITRGVHYFDPNETPDAFIYRTLGNQNPGTLSLEMADNYADDMLVLPRANQTNFNI